MKYSELLEKALQCTSQEREKQKQALSKAINEQREYLQREGPLMLQGFYTSLSRNDLLTKTFEQFKPNQDNGEILQKFQKWSPERQFGIFLYGTQGTGKTHLLKALAIKWGSEYYRTLFIATALIFDALREKLDSTVDVILEYSYPDLLIIDDFGAEKATEWTREKFLSILERRLRQDKITFISSNLNLDELQKKYDLRTLDRMKELMVFVEMPGKTFRNIQYQNNLNKWKKLK